MERSGGSQTCQCSLRPGPHKAQGALSVVCATEMPRRCVCTWQWAGGRSGLLLHPSAQPAPSRCAGVSAGQPVPLRPVLRFLPWFVTVYNRPAEVTCLLDSPDHNRQEASLCRSRFMLNSLPFPFHHRLRVSKSLPVTVLRICVSPRGLLCPRR